MTAFSSPDEDVILRKLDIHSDSLITDDEVDDVYEIHRCTQWIKNRNFSRVALQFPDELMKDASRVAGRIQNLTGQKIAVLGDTSYGSCCVDEVAAQHFSADSVIHFGHSCLSPTVRLPVLYVFGHQPIDISDCVGKFKSQFGFDESIVLVYDPVYQYAISNISNELQSYTSLTISVIDLPINQSGEDLPVNQCGDDIQINQCGNGSLVSQCEENFLADKELVSKCSCHEENITENQTMTTYTESQDSEVLSRAVQITSQGQNVEANSTNTDFKDSSEKSSYRKHGRFFPNLREEDVNTVFYIGQENLSLTNLMMTLNKCKFYSYNPSTQELKEQDFKANKALMKRFHMVERAKDARIVGIIAGTLGVANYLDIITRLKNMIKKAGKKCYTFVVGKLNVPKLANFMEIDIFVLVACPENTLLDSSEFFKPVVTPFEMELACNTNCEWDGQYITNFRDLLPGGCHYRELKTAEEDEADVSLVTGKMRVLGQRREIPELSSTAVMVRNEALSVTTVSDTAGDFLSSRSWRGLEQHLGQTEVADVQEGLHGIASGYSNEPQLK